MSNPKDTIPYGYCHCGCGKKTNIARQSRSSLGQIKGEPSRYLAGHSSRRPDPEFILEDRGYDTPCHIWQRSPDSSGYGIAFREGKPIMAHRLYYAMKNGPIPEGMVPDHLCRVPLCVNPDHLEAVTQTENIRRGKSAKITMETAALIRSLAGQVFQRDIAKRFGLSTGQVGRIIRGESWQ